MSEFYDDYHDDDQEINPEEWWNNQGPEVISDNRLRVLISGYEHGLTDKVVLEAGISAEGYDSELIDWSPELEPSDIGRGAIILALHPEKDSIQTFPGGELDYLRYVDVEGSMSRIVLSNSSLDAIGSRGIPYVQRPSVGESEADEIEGQVNLLEERLVHHYSNLDEELETPDIDEVIATEASGLNWDGFAADPDNFGKTQD